MWVACLPIFPAAYCNQGAINASPISAIRWLPGSENLFLASHMDGTLIVYDKEKDDTAFLPEENSASTEEKDGNVEDHVSLRIYKSVNSRNQKFNPVASWKISNQKINGFAFSPDGRHLAVVSEDGSLRIIDYLREKWVCMHAGVKRAEETDLLQANRCIYELLWWLYVCLLVARR